MYALEQIDVHIFGGNATSSLVSSIYCVFRSLLAVFILIGFAYGGLTGEQKSSNFAKCNDVAEVFSFCCKCMHAPWPMHIEQREGRLESSFVVQITS